MDKTLIRYLHFDFDMHQISRRHLMARCIWNLKTTQLTTFLYIITIYMITTTAMNARK